MPIFLKIMIIKLYGTGHRSMSDLSFSFVYGDATQARAKFNFWPNNCPIP